MRSRVWWIGDGWVSAHQDIWKDIGRGHGCLCLITENVMSYSMIPEVTLQSCLCLFTDRYNLWVLVARIVPQQISSRNPIGIFPQEPSWSQDCGVMCIGVPEPEPCAPLVRAMVLYQGSLCPALLTWAEQPAQLHPEHLTLVGSEQTLPSFHIPD